MSTQRNHWKHFYQTQIKIQQINETYGSELEKVEDGFLGRKDSITKDVQEEGYTQVNHEHANQRSQVEKEWETNAEVGHARLQNDLNEEHTEECWVQRWKCSYEGSVL